MTNRNSESFKSIHQQLEQHKQTPNKVLFSASNVLLPSNSRTSVESLNRNPAYSSAQGFTSKGGDKLKKVAKEGSI